MVVSWCFVVIVDVIYKMRVEIEKLKTFNYNDRKVIPLQIHNVSLLDILPCFLVGSSIYHFLKNSELLLCRGIYWKKKENQLLYTIFLHIPL